jgi:hypothetical protein
MALALLGGGITDMRGSVGGNTFSRSKYGVTVRAKTSPVQPQSVHQTNSRGQLVTVSRRWSQVLTATERSQWNAFALTQPQTNRFGQVSYLSGHQWFNKLNSVALSITAFNYLNTPPGTGSYPSVIGLSITADIGTLAMDIDYSGSPGTGTPYVLIYATNALSAGTYYVSSKLRLIGAQAAVDGTHSIKSLWQARYGTFFPRAGHKLFVLIVTANNDDGTSSPGLMANCIIT